MSFKSVDFVSDEVSSKFGLKKLASCEEEDKICQKDETNYDECCQRKETVFWTKMGIIKNIRKDYN